MEETRFYYLDVAKKPQGSFTQQELKVKFELGDIDGQTLVAAVGGAEWLPYAKRFPDTAEESTSSPPAAPTQSCPLCEHENTLSPEQPLLLRCDSCGRELAPDPTSSTLAHFKSSLRRYACFKGRATRKEYWSLVLWTYIVTFPLLVTQYIFLFPRMMRIFQYLQTQSPDTPTPNPFPPLAEMPTGLLVTSVISVLVSLALVLPATGVIVRRFHDIGLAGTIPFIGAILQVIVMTTLFGINLPTILTTLNSIMGLIVLVVAFIDSNRGENRFGPSVKYPQR